MSKKEKEEIIDSLVAEGIIGAALGLLLSNDKTSGTLVGGLAGAALFGSLKANEQAKKTEIPMLVEEDHVIYQVNKNGQKKVYKTIPKRKHNLPNKFKLK